MFLDPTLGLSPREDVHLRSFDMRDLVYIKLGVFDFN